jgi:hypothetical protein
MRHQRSDSFEQDFHKLKPDYRAGVRFAVSALLAAVADAKGAPPAFPDWMKVRRLPEVDGVWQMSWVLDTGASGRATFQYLKVDDAPTVRWRRVGPLAALEEAWAARQGQIGTTLLPHKAGMMAFARTQRGELVYLERARWHEHIVPAHIAEAPTARGKRTTTWWPVQHSASGSNSMSQDDVIGVIMDAVREGDWQNAPRGTLLSIYDLPSDKADRFGVSEVKVSAAPDGRILSAYPSRGSNVLAVREMTEEEMATAPAAVQSPQQPDESLFRTYVPQTSFG